VEAGLIKKIILSVEAGFCFVSLIEIETGAYTFVFNLKRSWIT